MNLKVWTYLQRRPQCLWCSWAPGGLWDMQGRTGKAFLWAALPRRRPASPTVVVVCVSATLTFPLLLDNLALSLRQSHRCLGNTLLYSDWFTGPEEDSWLACWGGDRRCFQTDTGTHELCLPEKMSTCAVDNLCLWEMLPQEQFWVFFMPSP